MMNPKKILHALTWPVGAAAALFATLFAALGFIPVLLGETSGAGFASVEASLCAYDRGGSVDILAAGDSRAETMIDPDVIEAGLGRRCVNVGEALNLGGDLATLVNALRRNPDILASRPILLISVSMDGVNDFSYSNTPSATLFNFRPWEHAALCVRDPGGYPAYLAGTLLPAVKREFIHAWKKDGFFCDEDVNLPAWAVISRGYRPYQGTRPESRKVGKQGRYHIEGARWRVFAASMKWLAASQARAVVIYDAPFDPEWLRENAGSPVAEMESRFARKVAREASRYPKIRYLDLFHAPPLGLEHGDFFDGGHLNREGAAKFSLALVDSIRGL
jgi:hypothetical protein